MFTHKNTKLLYSPTGEYNKTEICKMAASRFVEVTNKEISEIKINSVPKKTQKTCVKILKQLFTSGSTSSRWIFIR
jgi:tRNA U34 2-thiouridine synthase MnmA/TrmU